MKIIVTGLIGQYALGGVVWDYIQYMLGFQRLGHDVWYLEDTGHWPYDHIHEEITHDCTVNVAHVREVMTAFGFGDRWIYRNEPDGKYYGVENLQRAESIIREAQVLVNVSGACWLRPITAGIAHKLFIDGDPAFTQINCALEQSAKTLDHIRSHDHHFTFGLNLGQDNCPIPTLGIQWKPTIQPVTLDLWKPSPSNNSTFLSSTDWTTVMNWVSYNPTTFEGQTYGQKNEEFLKFIDLPKVTGERFTIAMGRGKGNLRPTEHLKSHSWRIVEPDEIISTAFDYRNFIFASKGEWSIAKNGYVQGKTGWFSCRSACYLAAHKPVVVQDTGWSQFLPTGDGLFAFRTLEEAAQGIHTISQNYSHHSEAARLFASKYLEDAIVCDKLLTQSGI